MADAFTSARVPRRAVLPLAMALRKAQPTPSSATKLHPLFLRVCLSAGVPNAATAVLADAVTEFDPGATGVTPGDVLATFYFSGCVHAARGRWDAAAASFLAAVTAPAGHASEIAVAAYKKWVLVSATARGGAPVPPLPRYIAPAVSRALRSDAMPYTDIGAALAAGGRGAVEVAAAATAALAADGNLGLARKALAAADDAALAGLGRTYTTLPLGGVLAKARAAATRARARAGGRPGGDDDAWAVPHHAAPQAAPPAGTPVSQRRGARGERGGGAPAPPPPPPPLPPLPTGDAAAAAGVAALLAAIARGDVDARMDGVAGVASFGGCGAGGGAPPTAALRALLAQASALSSRLAAATAAANAAAAERRAAAAAPPREPGVGGGDDGDRGDELLAAFA